MIFDVMHNYVPGVTPGVYSYPEAFVTGPSNALFKLAMKLHSTALIYYVYGMSITNDLLNIHLSL